MALVRVEGNICYASVKDAGGGDGASAAVSEVQQQLLPAPAFGGSDATYHHILLNSVMV